MPFDWMHPDLPASVVQRGPTRLSDDELGEADYRARLYFTLGYSLEEAKRRVLQNLRWEWELHKAPKHHKKAAEIVEQIYVQQRASAAPRTGQSAKAKKR
jgi:hypothetical protein